MLFCALSAKGFVKLSEKSNLLAGLAKIETTESSVYYTVCSLLVSNALAEYHLLNTLNDLHP